jgi:hypothetical protein
VVVGSLAVQCIFAVPTALRGVWSEMRGRYLRSLAVQCIFAVHTALRGVWSEMRGRYLRSLAVHCMFEVHSAVWGVSSEMCGRLSVVVGSPMHICGAHSGVGCVVRDARYISAVVGSPAHVLRCTQRFGVCRLRCAVDCWWSLAVQHIFAVHTAVWGVWCEFAVLLAGDWQSGAFCGEMGAVCAHAETIGGDAASG